MKDLWLSDTGADANPRAASLRLKSRSMSRAYGQRRHDFRKGVQPNYVQGERTHLNRVLLQPRPLPLIREEIETLRRERGAQRALKSNAGIVTAGIITFGQEAALLFEALSPDAQDAAFQSLARAVAERLDTQLEALLVHCDEVTLHAHFELRAYSKTGIPVSKIALAGVMSELQDLTAEIMGTHCPGIERGTKKYDRLAAGADYAATLNRSVKQLHRDLPKEIAAKEASLAELSDEVMRLSIALEKDKARVAKLIAMAERTAKEEKRLATYTERLKKRVVALKVAEKAVQEGEARNQRRTDAIIQIQKEQDARQSTQEAADALLLDRAAALETQEAQARCDAAALEAVTRELAENTVGHTAGRLTLQDPTPMLRASPPMRKRLAQVIRQHLGLRAALVDRMAFVDQLMTRVTRWLKRDDLPADARQEAEEIRQKRDEGPGF